MWGLNTGETTTSSTSYAIIDYAIYISGSNMSIYENGSSKGASTSYTTDDVLSINIDRESGVVTYLKNDVVFYTSTNIANLDAEYGFLGAPYSTGAGITDLKFSDTNGINIYENAGENQTIAVLSADDDDSTSWTYELVSGDGSTDNAAVSIGGVNGNELILVANPNASTQENYSVRVQVTDNHGNTYEEIIAFNVVPNAAPTDIEFSSTEALVVRENPGEEESITVLSAKDDDSSSWTYTLISGDGSSNNALVSIGGINGDELILKSSVDISEDANYSVRIQVEDNHGKTFEKIVEFKVLANSGTTSSNGDFTFGDVDDSTSSLLYTWGQAVQKFTGHTFGDNELNIPDITLDNLSDNTIVVLSNIQIGMVIFDKSNPDNTFTSSIYNTSVDVSSWDLENLSVNVAQNIFTHVNSYSYGSVYRTDAYQEEITLSVRTKDATNQEQGVIQEVSLSINVTESARWISSPIILDLDHDGIETLGLENAVRFDIDADGDKDKTGWVGADDGLLVRDINGDGIINDASELFGEETIKNDGTKAKDGYDALKELDSNNDGVINKDDELFDELKVWRDLNSDGITDENEMISLEAANVSEISLEYEESNIEDKGNIIGLQGSYKDNEGNEHAAADVWFSYDKNSASEGIDLDINRINNSTLNLNNDKQDIINLKFDELIASTNEDDELIILGERGDSIILDGGIKSDENEDGKWEQSGTKEDEEGKTYSIFQSTNGTSIVKLLIEEDIDINTF